MFLCMGASLFVVLYSCSDLPPRNYNLESWPSMFTGVSSIGLLVVGAFGHL